MPSTCRMVSVNVDQVCNYQDLLALVTRLMSPGLALVTWSILLCLAFCHMVDVTMNQVMHSSIPVSTTRVVDFT